MSASFRSKVSHLRVFKVAIGISASCLLLSGLVVACSNGGDDAADNAGTPTVGTSIEVEVFEVGDELAPEEEKVAPGTELVVGREGPREGGVLVVPLGQGCGIPDPAIDLATWERDLWQVAIVSEVYSGLTRIVDDPNSPVQPELAETFKVRKGGMV